MKNYSIFPEKARVLSNSVLKVIAVITMLIDHFASVFMRESNIELFGNFTLYDLMRAVGRISFPIFAFLLVEGFIHTRDRKKYGIRLFIFALISEVPWDLEHFGKPFYIMSQNVFFTLLIGYLCMCLANKAEESDKKLKYVLLLFGLLIAANYGYTDYGIGGVCFILILWFFRNYPVYRAILGICILSYRHFAGLAFIPIGLYNGKRGFIKGRILQFAFYAIYPAHMLIFYFIKAATIGY